MYKNILVAIDLEDEAAEPVLDCAERLAGEETTLWVAHVIDPQYLQYSFDPTFDGAWLKELRQRAGETVAKRLGDLCEPRGVAPAQQLVLEGHPAWELRKYAAENSIDLLVIGTHGRRGWQRLLGSTAAAVLHDTPTDVYVCRIQKPS